VLIDRLHQVEERIARACAQAGRPRQDVLLLAVTKVFPASAIHEAYALGLREFGENYVQEFETKADSVRALPGARFHLIGHLQSNKSKKAAELFDTVHTVDSLKLARRLAEAAGPQGIELLIEVKLSEEDSKHGCAPEELEELVSGIRALPNVRLSGLMTMPPWSEDPETARPYFIQLRELASRYSLPRLSMGMSNDLEVAIAEGSSIVRVGTALFGSRKQA
jgi:PLP dependent protein